MFQTCGCGPSFEQFWSDILLDGISIFCVKDIPMQYRSIQCIRMIRFDWIRVYFTHHLDWIRMINNFINQKPLQILA